MINRAKTLPEFSIGKSGHELFSGLKDLTIVTVPYERFSIFPKAVDALFKTVHIPFNLIIVESSAPEQIRAALERRRYRHLKNITIIYTQHIPPTYSAFNLAIPHLKTKYAFMMANDVKIQKGSLESLMEHVRRHECDIVCPQNSVISREIIHMNNNHELNLNLSTLGLKTSFLISQKALKRVGKFDCAMNAFTGAIDTTLIFKEKKLDICIDPNSFMHSYPDHFTPEIDSDLYVFQWSIEKNNRCLKRLEDKWNIRLPKDAHTVWFRDKSKSKNSYAFTLHLFAQLFGYVLKSVKALVNSLTRLSLSSSGQTIKR